jgi:nitroimidazol reductase NimA-like FMN-containing flavoprotein (pyridoxamine 5'-phosphate oxidase superfamily)
MSAPIGDRPFMPGYGLLPADQGAGLLPWSWAEERLVASRNYWVATAWPDGRPHVMPVWGMWQEGAFWFSSSNGSRKARNLNGDSRCVVTTEDPDNPVVVEGRATLVADPGSLAKVLAWENAKYSTDYTLEMLDPKDNSCFRVDPTWAFAIRQGEFTGSPTRWRF